MLVSKLNPDQSSTLRDQAATNKEGYYRFTSFMDTEDYVLESNEDNDCCGESDDDLRTNVNSVNIHVERSRKNRKSLPVRRCY
ncbi:CARDB domain-containing protein [Dyadobacter frigoris]|uniref:CARDB domain-containing protein n=1 Tax=Dyadobacter frigoris TaxID=2576211 RepID=A0A4U6D6F4_9BACT|nr:hypothetical protein FDK13_07590 [Dyadobacter frigoris]